MWRNTGIYLTQSEQWISEENPNGKQFARDDTTKEEYLKQQLGNKRDRQQISKQIKDKEVKKKCKQDKRDYIEHLAQQAENACEKGDIKSLYNITRQLGGRPFNNNTPVKDK